MSGFSQIRDVCLKYGRAKLPPMVTVVKLKR